MLAWCVVYVQNLRVSVTHSQYYTVQMAMLNFKLVVLAEKTAIAKSGLALSQIQIRTILHSCQTYPSSLICLDLKSQAHKLITIHSQRIRVGVEIVVYHHLL